MNEIMNNILPISMIVVAIVICGILYFVLKKKKSKEDGLYKLKTFLTNNEKDCFIHLNKELSDYIICPQVSMGALLDPVLSTSSANSNERSEAFTLRNKISSKIIDFVIMDKASLNPVFIVELDDKSHDTKKDMDDLRDKHLALAGIYTVRFRREGGSFPKRSEILSKLNEQKKKYK